MNEITCVSVVLLLVFSIINQYVYYIGPYYPCAIVILFSLLALILNKDYSLLTLNRTSVVSGLYLIFSSLLLYVNSFDLGLAIVAISFPIGIFIYFILNKKKRICELLWIDLFCKLLVGLCIVEFIVLNLVEFSIVPKFNTSNQLVYQEIYSSTLYRIFGIHLRMPNTPFGGSHTLSILAVFCGTVFFYQTKCIPKQSRKLMLFISILLFLLNPTFSAFLAFIATLLIFYIIINQDLKISGFVVPASILIIGSFVGLYFLNLKYPSHTFENIYHLWVFPTIENIHKFDVNSLVFGAGSMASSYFDIIELAPINDLFRFGLLFYFGINIIFLHISISAIKFSCCNTIGLYGFLLLYCTLSNWHYSPFYNSSLYLLQIILSSFVLVAYCSDRANAKFTI